MRAPSTFNLFAIYDAENSLKGELHYALQKSLGRQSCALCDITHGWNPMGKHGWRNRKGLSATLHWLHRNEISPALGEKLAEHALPCVVAEVEDQLEILIDSTALAGCEGDFAVFEHLLEQKVRALLQIRRFTGTPPLTR